nr:hypothetical protein TQ38_24055 [Novosphingobium sp. P6W]
MRGGPYHWQLDGSAEKLKVEVDWSVIVNEMSPANELAKRGNAQVNAIGGMRAAIERYARMMAATYATWGICAATTQP